MTTVYRAAEVIAELSGDCRARIVAIAEMLDEAGLLTPAPRERRPVTTVYRAYSPTRNKAGTTFADHARAQAQAAVRNQFVECDPNTDELADWYVQAGHVQWETP